jgi:DNA-binding NarL/FixJ family response regulator
MSERPDMNIRSVVVAGPDHLQVERIRALISDDPDLEIVATASRRDDAVDLLWDLEPEVAIIDVNLLSFCDRPLHGWGPISQGIRLVAVGPGEDPYLSSTLRAAGFAAYVPEDRMDEQLCGALRTPAEPRRTSASRSLPV